VQRTARPAAENEIIFLVPVARSGHRIRLRTRKSGFKSRQGLSITYRKQRNAVMYSMYYAVMMPSVHYKRFIVRKNDRGQKGVCKD
jgi:hypothetical protein